MKRAKQYLGLFLLAGLILAISNPTASAQNRNKKGACKFLTEEQQKQATDIKAKYQKDITYLHNKLNELSAKEKTLVQVDNPSLKQIYSNIEAKTELHNKIAKTKAKMHIELRNIMTEEQRLIMGSGMGKKMSCKEGMHRGMRKHNMRGNRNGRHQMNKGCTGDCASCKTVKGNHNRGIHANKEMHKIANCNSCGEGQRMQQRCNKGNFHGNFKNNKKGNCGAECRMNLTEEQQASLKKLRLEKLKTVTPLKNKLNELRARKHTLMSANQINNREVNKIIDQMADIKEDIAKANIKQKIEMRKLLTEEQKAMFGKGMHRNKCNRQ